MKWPICIIYEKSISLVIRDAKLKQRLDIISHLLGVALELSRGWALSKYLSNFMAFVVILDYGFRGILNGLPIIKEMQLKQEILFFTY